MLHQGRWELGKALWHGGLLLLFGGATIYNAAAWLVRREGHLARNAVVYGAGVAYEIPKIQAHLRSHYGK